MTWILVSQFSFIFLALILLVTSVLQIFGYLSHLPGLLIAILPYPANFLILHLQLRLLFCWEAFIDPHVVSYGTLLCAVCTFPNGSMYPSDYDCLVTCQYFPPLLEALHGILTVWPIMETLNKDQLREQTKALSWAARGFGILLTLSPFCIGGCYVKGLPSCWYQIDCFKNNSVLLIHAILSQKENSKGH